MIDTLSCLSICLVLLYWSCEKPKNEALNNICDVQINASLNYHIFHGKKEKQHLLKNITKHG